MENKESSIVGKGNLGHEQDAADMSTFYGNAASAAATGYTFDPHAEKSPAEETDSLGPGPDPDGPAEAGDASDSPASPENRGEGFSGSDPSMNSDNDPADDSAARDVRTSEEQDEASVGAAPDFAAFHHQETLPEESSGVQGSVPAVQHTPSAGDDDDEDEGAEDDEPMSLMGHLNELRRRLFRIVIIVILGFVAFYGVSEQLYAYLSEPLRACLPEGSKLVYTSPQGAFFTYMKVALVASLFGTSPFSFYQIWAFIAPGLYREEKRAVLPLAFFSSIFFLAGASFCFLLVFPIAFQFFMGFATDTIVPMISVEEYLSFALKLLIAFGVVFEMPLFAYFLARFGVLTPEFMRRSRRYAVLVIFIVAAILTPPDVFSQVLMALPMLLLYEVSIYVASAAYPKKKKQETEDASEEKE